MQYMWRISAEVFRLEVSWDFNAHSSKEMRSTCPSDCSLFYIWHQNKIFVEVNARAGQQRRLCSVCLWSDPADMGEKKKHMVPLFHSFLPRVFIFLVLITLFFFYHLKVFFIFQVMLNFAVGKCETSCRKKKRRLRTTLKSSWGKYSAKDLNPGAGSCKSE